MLRRSVVIEVINPLDEDGDGLIDITTLAQLNVLRFDLNGNGMVDTGVDAIGRTTYEAAFDLRRGEVACVSGCVGYELMNSLDFKNESADPSMFSVWAEGSSVPNAVAEGWMPIGTSSSPYTATFEGNGYTISSIFIDRPSTALAGLFGVVRGGTIRGLGLEDGAYNRRRTNGRFSG